jgi:16S rRNA (cytosine967-C5)-methyltransferase
MPTRSGTLTRSIAIDALTHILFRNQHSDNALDKLFNTHKDLRALDRAFIYEMVLGSLRWMSKMDWIMSHMIDRPFSSLDPRVANALRIGTYQIYYMNKVPPRAAVSETVEAIKKIGLKQAASFVNAVLRRVARKAEYFPKPDKDSKRLDYYAMHYAHPRWMLERWSRYIPRERLEFLMIGNNTHPKHTLRILKHNPLPTHDNNLLAYLLRHHGINSHWRPLQGVLQTEFLPSFTNCPAFSEGCYIVQDEGAQLTASLIQAKPHHTCLDACGALGGKAIYLWDEGLPPENLTVCDISERRLEKTKENFERVKLHGATLICSPAQTAFEESKKFDKIIIDAPCSSTGVIRRHPEIKWLRTYSEIEQSAQKQKELLNQLVKNLAPEGEIIYIVCSIELEETTEQIDNFLKQNPEFEKVPLMDRLHDYYKKYVTCNHELVILPGNQDEIDGFFAAVLKKKG